MARLRDAGLTGLDCMLLCVIQAGALKTTPAALRARIADAIDALDDAGRETIVRDIVEPAKAASVPVAEILGATAAGLAESTEPEAFHRWSQSVRRGGKMLGAPELHVLKPLLAAEGLHVAETSLSALREGDELLDWARKQTRQAECAPCRVALLATDGSHYNWVQVLPEGPDGPDGPDGPKGPGGPDFRERRVRPGARAAAALPDRPLKRPCRPARCGPNPAPCGPNPAPCAPSDHRAKVAAVCTLGALVLVGVLVLSGRRL